MSAHSDAFKRHAKLSWEILEHRFRYYILDDNIITDYEYDLLENEYKDLSLALGVPDSACEMVGWDHSKPSAQLVAKTIMEKLSKVQPQKTKPYTIRDAS